MSGADPQPEALETERQLLCFRVGGGDYALDILRVREIIPHGDITHLPRVPDFVSGLMNLRGSVVPIVDLGIRLGFAPIARTKLSSVVVTELELDGEPTRIGLLTDDVNEVLETVPGDIEPAPKLGAPVSAEVLSGVAKVDGRFVLILDVDALVGEAAMRSAWDATCGAPSPSDPARAPADDAPVADETAGTCEAELADPGEVER